MGCTRLQYRVAVHAGGPHTQPKTPYTHSTPKSIHPPVPSQYRPPPQVPDMCPKYACPEKGAAQRGRHRGESPRDIENPARTRTTRESNWTPNHPSPGCSRPSQGQILVSPNPGQPPSPQLPQQPRQARQHRNHPRLPAAAQKLGLIPSPAPQRVPPHVPVQLQMQLAWRALPRRWQLCYSNEV